MFGPWNSFFCFANVWLAARVVGPCTAARRHLYGPPRTDTTGPCSFWQKTAGSFLEACQKSFGSCRKVSQKTSEKFRSKKPAFVRLTLFRSFLENFRQSAGSCRKLSGSFRNFSGRKLPAAGARTVAPQRPPPVLRLRQCKVLVAGTRMPRLCQVA
jgi:hypothetical protein